MQKNTENLDPEISSMAEQFQVMTEKWYYQSVQYLVVKNPDLLKTKKQKDH